MNPSANERSGLDLPAPIAPESATPKATPEAAVGGLESAPQGAEKGPANAQPKVLAIPQIPLPTLPTIPPNGQQNDVSNTTQTVVPDAADDGDLIEKEWVNKAKQIVEHTREDPYQQSEQLTVVKADYMKKRYNKTLKLSE